MASWLYLATSTPRSPSPQIQASLPWSGRLLRGSQERGNRSAAEYVGGTAIDAMAEATAMRHGRQAEAIHPVGPGIALAVEEHLAQAEAQSLQQVRMAAEAMLQGDLLLQPGPVGGQGDPVAEEDIGRPILAEIQPPLQDHTARARLPQLLVRHFDQASAGLAQRAAYDGERITIWLIRYHQIIAQVHHT